MAEIFCFRDCSPAIRTTNNIKNIIEGRVISRLLDSYWYAPAYGVKLQNELNRIDVTTLPTLERRCEAEILKEPLIATCKVQIELNETTRLATVYVNVTPNIINNPSVDNNIFISFMI